MKLSVGEETLSSSFAVAFVVLCVSLGVARETKEGTEYYYILATDVADGLIPILIIIQILSFM